VRLLPRDKEKGFIAGEPFSAVVTVRNGDRPGLGQIKLRISGETTKGWVWLWPEERTEVIFHDLLVPYSGQQELQVGHLSQQIRFTDDK
jgi:hypothetical protein